MCVCVLQYFCCSRLRGVAVARACVGNAARARHLSVDVGAHFPQTLESVSAELSSAGRGCAPSRLASSHVNWCRGVVSGLPHRWRRRMFHGRLSFYCKLPLSRIVFNCTAPVGYGTRCHGLTPEFSGEDLRQDFSPVRWVSAVDFSRTNGSTVGSLYLSPSGSP